MKKQLLSLVIAATACTCVAPQASAADMREHRAVWMTPFLSDWPSSALTQMSAEANKRVLGSTLDKFVESGINIVYFHVRSHCDANYRSKYEPWSEFVAGTRGNEPAFDPLEYLLQEAHARGIEVYAWFNPYRYCGQYSNGDSPLDYELTHPDWLIVQQGKETILNPALEEVKQRICDVIADCVDNYDIDGVIFDDYFYSNPTPMALDADLYNAAKEADPSVGTQLEWRVANVNDMVRRVSATVKEHKPYLPFGISPAGIASPPHTSSEYGLEPISGDWQYSAIASDPLSWYKDKTVDFMAPQIYWPDRFEEIQAWWNTAARHFGRHLYSAVTLSDATYYGAKFAADAVYSRELLAPGENGMSFFRMNDYINTVFRYEGKGVEFHKFMGEHAFGTPALTPLRPWNNVYAPAYVNNLRRDGNTLRWDAVEGMRYTVYAFKAGEEQKPFSTNLVQVRYQADFEIPKDMTDCTFGVAVYDRYGNEYSMATEGGVRGAAVVPVLTYPADGAEAADLFDFAWQDTGCDNILEVASDQAFENILVMTPTAGSAVSSYAVPGLETGKTYWWRVRTSGVNAESGISEARSFTASRLAVTAPEGSDESLTPTVTWTPAYDGSSYFVEISRNADFSTLAYTATTDRASVTVDADSLCYGSRYYCRVTASRNGHSSRSEAVTFWTADAVPGLPTFVNPTAAGTVLHADEAVEVARPAGASSMQVQIATTEDFSAGYYRCTLRLGETQTALLSKVRIKGKKLADGTTYYVRACARYFTQSNQSAELDTDFAATSFVYSSELGVSDVAADDAAVSVTPEGILTTGVAGCRVGVYRADGTCVWSENCAESVTDLSHLAPGFYVIDVNGPVAATLKWIKR